VEKRETHNDNQQRLERKDALREQPGSPAAKSLKWSNALFFSEYKSTYRFSLFVWLQNNLI